MLKPKLEIIEPKKLIGQNLIMNLAEDKTPMLWRNFMPYKHLISNSIGTEVLSLQVYPEDFFSRFDPHKNFVKWALVEVKSFEKIPENMHSFELAGGLYAVFDHVGFSNVIFEEIFNDWLPQSGYTIDSRPHFEVLGEKYKPNDPSSEEKIYVPITN